MASRRSLLGRGALLVAGALGVTAAQRSNAAHAAVPLPAKGAAKATELSLYARNFHLQAPTHRAGQLPAGGDRHSAYGELLDRPNGKVIGHFTAAHLPRTPRSRQRYRVSRSTRSTSRTGPSTASEPHSAEQRGASSILGGTGRYAGVSGSYVATQRQREHGGNGTADFHLKLAA